MKLDPYAFCACHSGTKVKFCNQKFLNGIFETLYKGEKKQFEAAFKQLELVDDELATKPCQKMLAGVTRARVMYVSGQTKAALELLESLAEAYPDYSLPHEYLAVFGNAEDPNPQVAIRHLRHALETVAPDMRDLCARLLNQMTVATLENRDFLASWACARRLLKMDPADQKFQELNAIIQDAEPMPGFVRKGLTLKPADELFVFSEERQARWDAALKSDLLDHPAALVDAFEFLVDDDPSDAPAWYNLALSACWNGNSPRGLEAIERYIDLENDPESVNMAVELRQLISLSRDNYTAMDQAEYLCLGFCRDFNRDAIIDAAKRGELTFLPSPRTDADEQPKIEMIIPRFNYMERPSETPLIGRRNSVLARVSLVSTGLLVVAGLTKQDALDGYQRFAQLEQNTQLLSDSAVEYLRPGLLHNYLRVGKFFRHEDQKLTTRDLEQYFEQEWIHRSLPSLGNISPLDAVQSPRYRKRLEGVVRYLEFEHREQLSPVGLNGVRNRLGLMEHVFSPDVSLAEAKVPISQYSNKQLAALDTQSLSAADLREAYHAALSLESPRTANRFAHVLVEKFREGLTADELYGLIPPLLEENTESNSMAMVEKLVGLFSESPLSNQPELAARIAYLRTIYGGLLGDANTTDWAAVTDAIKTQLPPSVVVEKLVQRLFSNRLKDQALTVAEAALDTSQRERDRDGQSRYRDLVAALRTGQY